MLPFNEWPEIRSLEFRSVEFDSSLPDTGRLSEYELLDAEDGLGRLEASRLLGQAFSPTTILPSSCSSPSDRFETFRSFALFGSAAFSSGRYFRLAAVWFSGGFCGCERKKRQKCN